MLAVRKANKADVPRILEIYAPYIKNTTITFEYTVPTIEEFTARFESISSEFPYYVAEDGGRVVGYAYGSRAFERAAYAWDADFSIYIDSEYFSKGIGKLLAHAVEDELRTMGYHNIYAIITGENERSLRFHEKLGYSFAGKLSKSGYKNGKWLDVYWYEKRLCPAEKPVPIKKKENGNDL